MKNPGRSNAETDGIGNIIQNPPQVDRSLTVGFRRQGFGQPQLAGNRTVKLVEESSTDHKQIGFPQTALICKEYGQ